jgi:hypothetical protein
MLSPCWSGIWRVACLAIAQALWTAPVDARDWHVNLSHPEATDPPADQAPDPRAGTADRPLKSINAAAAVAQPGDTVLVHPGIYRECVRPVRCRRSIRCPARSRF